MGGAWRDGASLHDSIGVEMARAIESALSDGPSQAGTGEAPMDHGDSELQRSLALCVDGSTGSSSSKHDRAGASATASVLALPDGLDDSDLEPDRFSDFSDASSPNTSPTKRTRMEDPTFTTGSASAAVIFAHMVEADDGVPHPSELPNDRRLSSTLTEHARMDGPANTNGSASAAIMLAPMLSIDPGEESGVHTPSGIVSPNETLASINGLAPPAATTSHTKEQEEGAQAPGEYMEGDMLLSSPIKCMHVDEVSLASGPVPVAAAASLTTDSGSERPGRLDDSSCLNYAASTIRAAPSPAVVMAAHMNAAEGGRPSSVAFGSDNAAIVCTNPPALTSRVAPATGHALDSSADASFYRGWEYGSFNTEQLAFITQPACASGKLLGVPGGGKTRTILGRVSWLYERGLIPDRGFLVLTFNRAACEDLLTKAQSLIAHVPGFASQIRTIHSVAGSLVQVLAAREAGGGHGGDISTVIFRATRALGDVGDGAGATARAVDLLHNVQTIMVDEAQDLNQAQYDFVQALGCALGAPVVLIGDPNQSIYQFQGGSDRFLREHPGFTVSLVKNYRATVPLVKVIDAARPNRRGALEAAGDGIPLKPRFMSSTVEEVERDILEQVRAAMARRSSVAIVGPVKRCRPGSGQLSGAAAASLTNMGLQWVAQLLRSEGIPMLLHYDEGIVDADDNRASQGSVSKKVFSDSQVHDRPVVHLLTLHGAKGLEFDDVLVLNFHHATLGRVPTSRSEEQALAYLWYVALSRARTRMTVYQFTHRAVWPGLFRHDLLSQFDVVGQVPKDIPQPPRAESHLESQLQQSPESQHWSVTDLLKSRAVLTEQHLTTLHELLQLELRPLAHLPDSPVPTQDRLRGDQGAELPLFGALRTLYGLWAETTFFHAYRGESPPCLKSIQKMLECAVKVDKARVREYATFCKVMGLKASEPVRWVDIDERRSGIVGDHLQPILGWLDQVRAAHPAWTHVFVYTPNIVQWLDLPQLRALCERWNATVQAGQRLSMEDIWQMSLFVWQFHAEAAYRWDMSYQNTFAALRPFDQRIRAWAETLSDGWTFQVEKTLHHLPVAGQVDGWCPDASQRKARLLELKFSPTRLTLQHGLQAALYAEMFAPEYKGPQVDVEAWNLWTGERVCVERTACPELRWRWQHHLAQVLNRLLVNTVWLYGVDAAGSHPRTCELQGLHMQDVTTGLVPVSTLVRSTDVPERVSAVTGITTDLVRLATPVDQVVQALECALAACQMPLMVAWRGHQFDHGVLQHLLSASRPNGSGVLRQVRWVDPLPVLSGAIPTALPTYGMALASMYEVIMGAPYEGPARGAAATVVMLQQLIDKLAIPVSKWFAAARTDRMAAPHHVR